MAASVLLLAPCALSVSGFTLPVRPLVSIVGRSSRSVRSCDVDIESLDPRSPQYREAVMAKAAAIKAARLERAAELELSSEEIAALTEASKSLDACWQGDMAELPKALKSPFGNPEDFFGMLRSPKTDPAPEVWDCVRQKWPVLATRSDDDLVAVLQPIKDVYVDRRSLK